MRILKYDHYNPSCVGSIIGSLVSENFFWDIRKITEKTSGPKMDYFGTTAIISEHDL